jgi:outer membrane protein assembly factor BamB
VRWATTALVTDAASEVAGIPMLAMQDGLGLVLVASRVHGCAALRLGDGTVAWTRPIGQQCAAVGAGPGGMILAGGRDGLIARLDRDGTVIGSSRTQRSRAASIAGSADGARVIVGGADGTLRILDAATLDQVLAIRVSNAALDCMWSDDDGIWTIDRDGVMRCR